MQKSMRRRTFLEGAAASTAAMALLGSPGRVRIASAGEVSADLPVPDWVRRLTRMTFGGQDAVALAAETGAELLHTNLVWPYFPLRRDGGGLSTDDDAKMRRLVSDGKKHGVRIGLGLPPFPSIEHVRKHPDWRVHPDRNGPPTSEPTENDLGTRLGCNLGPWGNYLIELCGELVADYGIDSLSFDGNYHSPVCYCPACVDAYKRETGREIPGAVNLDDVAYREYLVWRGDKLDDHYRRLRVRIRQANPEAAVITWAVNAGRYGHLLTSPRVTSTRLNQIVDMPMQEWWGDETNLGASVAPAFAAAYLKAVAGDRPAASEPYLMSRGNPYGTDSFPAHERLARTKLALSHGCVAAESLGWPGHLESAKRSLFEAGKLVDSISGARPVGWVGMLVSEQTRQFYAYQDIPDRFLPHVYGGFRAAIEEHMPVVLLNDWDLTPERLAEFEVLLLPNSAAFSADQVSAVRSYVESGGGLVATGETSLCDELGRPRGDFSLADLFGVHYQGRPNAPIDRPALDSNFAIAIDESYWAQRVGLATLSWESDMPLSSPALDSLVPTRSVNFRGPLVKVSEPADAKEAAIRMRPEGWTEAPLSAAIVRSFGRGKVVYLAAGLDAALWSYAYPYQRCLLANALRWAAQAPPAVRVTAPMCVQLTCFEQGPNRLLVHLYNGVNTSAHHGLPAVDVPLREESLPIHGIQLSLPAPRWKRFRIEPEGSPIDARTDGGRTSIDLPPLNLHMVVVCQA